MKKILLSIMFISSFAIGGAKAISEEAPNNDFFNKKEIRHIMLISKMAGLCSTLAQMSSFQNSTKMPGATEFLTQFVNTEAARLGETTHEFLTRCRSSVDQYDGIYKAFEKD